MRRTGLRRERPNGRRCDRRGGPGTTPQHCCGRMSPRLLEHVLEERPDHDLEVREAQALVAVGQDRHPDHHVGVGELVAGDGTSLPTRTASRRRDRGMRGSGQRSPQVRRSQEAEAHAVDLGGRTVGGSTTNRLLIFNFFF